MAVFSRLFSSVFGSNLQSDRNVPAGDDLVKIDVNSFPVLILLTRGTQKHLSDTHTHTTYMGGEIYEILLFCAFFEYSFNRKLS